MRSLIPWKRSKSVGQLEKRGSFLDRFRNNSFDDFFKTPFMDRLPAVDVSEKKGAVAVRAELPGLTEKDLELTFQDGMLTIKGEKKEDRKEEKKNTFYKECRYGSFSRTIPLPKGVRWEEAKAKFKNGVLTVCFPKKETEEKTVSIKVE